ncbi:MAG: hypothetical protein KJ977_01210 [Candidatus Omnitrophica bacterium]|nr:hypothetical protein [Candidatus Omnitrophota bacterium]MBU2265636.1 hypothetical protein [Candidatus Omnitrophota bacterium]MBU2473570.1 hypothetical protein [Candidatus Omnitrophota bacterium]
MKAIFKTEQASFSVEFNDSLTAREIFAKLPLNSTVSTWGDEIYFDIGFKASAQGATMEVSVGDVAYWPQGKCLCVFFGPTPDSVTQEPVPASPVVIVGKASASQDQLRAIELGEKIIVSAAGIQK